MDCITLTDFRASLYAAFHAGGDILLNIVDALATETAAQSLPECWVDALDVRRIQHLLFGKQGSNPLLDPQQMTNPNA